MQLTVGQTIALPESQRSQQLKSFPGHAGVAKVLLGLNGAIARLNPTIKTKYS